MVARAACIVAGLLLLAGCPEASAPVDNIVMGDEEVAALDPSVETGACAGGLDCCTKDHIKWVAAAAYATENRHCNAPGAQTTITGASPGVDVCASTDSHVGYAISCRVLKPQ